MSPTSSILLAGVDITGAPPDKIARQGLAPTHQIVKPLNQLTVLENVMVGETLGHTGFAAPRPRKLPSQHWMSVGIAPVPWRAS